MYGRSRANKNRCNQKSITFQNKIFTEQAICLTCENFRKLHFINSILCRVKDLCCQYLYLPLNCYNVFYNKSLLKETFCPKGGSSYRISGIENMNIFRQDVQTVLFILKSFGRLLPLPGTILPDHPMYYQTVNSSQFLRAVFLPHSRVRVFLILVQSRSHF